MKILYPIELLLSSVFSFSYNLTGHYGYALILMSVCITIITTPIYLVADYWKNQEKKIQDLMKEDIDCIKSHYSKQKQFYLTQAAHRIYNYKAWYPLRTSLGILIEIPFFFAAFNVLSNFKGYSGVTFGPIKDLGAPDGLLWTINLLPIVMTLLNVVSSIVYSRSFKLSDNTQPFVLAAVFLLFLYDSPAALLIYWSFNNFFSLVKNIIIELTKKKQEKFVTVKLIQEIRNNKNLVLYILCTLLYIGFTFIMSYDHHKIKYCFLLLSAIQAGLFVYFFIVRKKKFNMCYFMAYAIYAVCSLAYFKRSHVFDFDAALVIICILNCLLFYYLFQRTDIFETKEKSLKSDLSVIILCSLIFTVLLPLQVYFSNKLEFPIKVSEIVIKLLITFIIVSLILILLNNFVFKKTNFLSKSLLFILLLYFFNGIFLRLNAGMMSEFGFQNDSVIRNPSLSLFFKDFIVILFAIYIVNYLFTKKKSFILPVYIISTIVFTISIISGAIKYKDIKLEITNTYKDIPSDTKEIHTFTRTGQNVYIFMSDMMNGNYMGRILEENPEYAESFSGFTWYRDCLSKSSDTQTSMMSLYGGNNSSLIEFNLNDSTTEQFMHNAADKMLKSFIEKNWSVAFGSYTSYFDANKETLSKENIHHFYSDAYSDYFAKENNFDIYSSRKDYLLQLLPVYNMLPHSSKKYLYQKGFWLNPLMQIKERQIEACTDVSHVELIPQFINFTDVAENQFKFFVSEITHTSWVYNENGKIFSSYDDLEITDEDLSYYAARRAINLLANLVRTLKENKAYDNTIIIFVSDHGNQLENNGISTMNGLEKLGSDYKHNLSMANTVLLIKGFNDTGTLKVSDAQVQNSDIYDYLQENVFESGNVFSDYLNYSENTPRTRTYSVDLYQKNDFSKLQEVPCVNYKVEGSIFKSEAWSLIGE